jgi:hypothetical protein
MHGAFVFLAVFRKVFNAFSHDYRLAVFAAFLNCSAVGAPGLPGRLMRSLEPPAMRSRFFIML